MYKPGSFEQLCQDFSPEHWDCIIDCTGYVKSLHLELNRSTKVRSDRLNLGQLPAIDGVIKAQDLPRDEAAAFLSVSIDCSQKSRVLRIPFPSMQSC